MRAPSAIALLAAALALTPAAPTAARAASLAVPAPVIPVAAFADTEAAYGSGGQFSARYDQTRNRWHLQTLDGRQVALDAGACATGHVLPTGVWLLVLDGRGHAGLVAPSTTRLPAGAPDHVALRECREAEGTAIAVPKAVLDLLVTQAGAVYVSR